MSNEKIIKKVTSTINFPEFISIGDPWYYETETDRLKDLIYERKFKRKPDWVGHLEVVEKKGSYDMDGEEFNYTDNCFKAIYAENAELLQLLKNGEMFTNLTEKVYHIGVDTAEYGISIDDNGEIIHTGFDGSVGVVVEVYRKRKLVALILDFTTGDHNDYELIKEKISFIFNTNLE